MTESHEPEGFGPIAWARSLTGIYGHGFDRGSIAGLLVPGAVVTAIGGVLGYIIWQVL